MIEIKEYPYDKEELVKILNRKWETLLAIDNGLIITKVVTKTSRQLVAKTHTQKFFEQFNDLKAPVIDTVLMSEIADELWINWNEKKWLLAKFINFRTEWKTNWKAKWEKEKTFEVVNRFRTFLDREKPDVAKKVNNTIRKI